MSTTTAPFVVPRPRVDPEPGRDPTAGRAGDRSAHLFVGVGVGAALAVMLLAWPWRLAAVPEHEDRAAPREPPGAALAAAPDTSVPDAARVFGAAARIESGPGEPQPPTF
jgi:hypothetical protein